ncbi:MAG: hypothetical protein JWQ88_1778 [Rhodoferax sp.]|nr:hypothetical protein [Rhodoferax sp.]
MSDTTNFDFSKFVPGFDFLQNLAKGSTQKMPQMPKLGSWVAPTINVEELEKRIDELKAVQFWLDQNAVALKATIQALEVQKMTLATLQGMNFSMGDLADAFKIKTPDAAGPAESKPEPRKPFEMPSAAPAAASSATDDSAATESDGGANGKAAASVVDPLQWWNSLTTQFQQIAAGALKDAATKTAEDSTKAASFAKDAFKSAEAFAKVATKPLTSPLGDTPPGATSAASGKTATAAKQAPARKAAGKTAAAKKRAG